jgi:hypothetical protein
MTPINAAAASRPAMPRDAGGDEAGCSFTARSDDAGTDYSADFEDGVFRLA